MNILSMKLIRFLALKLYFLSKINFKGLSIKITDYRETILEY